METGARVLLERVLTAEYSEKDKWSLIRTLKEDYLSDSGEIQEVCDCYQKGETVEKCLTRVIGTPHLVVFQDAADRKTFYACYKRVEDANACLNELGPDQPDVFSIKLTPEQCKEIKHFLALVGIHGVEGIAGMIADGSTDSAVLARSKAVAEALCKSYMATHDVDETFKKFIVGYEL